VVARVAERLEEGRSLARRVGVCEKALGLNGTTLRRLLMRALVVALVPAALAACPALAAQAPPREPSAMALIRQREERRLAEVKRAIGFDSLPATQTVRGAAGLSPAALGDLAGFTVQLRSVEPWVAHGMLRKLRLRSADGLIVLGTVFVGRTARDAQEMLVGSMMSSTLPVRLIAAVDIRRTAPGDFHMVRRGGPRGAAPGLVRLVRGNIAVALTATKPRYDLLPLARAFDLRILAGDAVTSEQYDRLLPRIEIVGISPKAPVKGDTVRLSYRIASEIGDGTNVVAAADPPTALQVKEIKSHGITFVAATSVQARAGVALCHKRSLLSRWAWCEVPIQGAQDRH